MNKKLIRLTESDLHRIVKESVNKILSEVSGVPNAHKGKYVPAYWEKGEPRRERSDYDDNEEFVNEGNIQEYMDRNSGYNRQAWTEMGAAAQGLADGSTWGAKLKGMINPKWKERKDRQATAFYNRANDMRYNKAKSMATNDEQEDFFRNQLRKQDTETEDAMYRNPSSIRGFQYGFGH